MSLKQNVNTVSGIVAGTTQTQAGAVALDPGITVQTVTTVTVAGDGVRLPPASPGKILIVVNGAAANAMAVYPSSGDSINALSANTSLSVAANKAVFFVVDGGTKWRSILTA